MFQNLEKNLPTNELITVLELRFGGYKMLPTIYYNNKIQGNGSLLVTVRNYLKNEKNNGVTYAQNNLFKKEKWLQILRRKV